MMEGPSITATQMLENFKQARDEEPVTLTRGQLKHLVFRLQIAERGMGTEAALRHADALVEQHIREQRTRG